VARSLPMSGLEAGSLALALGLGLEAGSFSQLSCPEEFMLLG